MKKFLLGSTALVAASFIAGGVAQAEDQPIAVTVGGYYQNAMGLIDQDSEDNEFADETNSFAFGQDVEINVGGSAVLDNGLTVGFKAVIEGNAGGDQSETMDERFVFFRGNFGQIRMGATESAMQEFTNFAPGGAGIFGVNTPFFIFANPGNNVGNLDFRIFNVTTYDDLLGAEDDLKIVYFSPSFGGFSFAASYAPSDNTNAQYGNNARSGAAFANGDQTGVGTLLDQLSVAAAFDRAFGDFKIRVAAGYSSYNLDKCNSSTPALADHQNCEDSPESFHAGATFTIGKFAVGGGYTQRDFVVNISPVGTALTGADRERQDFDIGISYWDAMWGVGIQYGNAEADGPTGGVNDDLSLDIIEVDGSYILGPGVSLQAALRFGDFTDDAPQSPDRNDNEFVEFLVGSSMSF